MADVNITLPDGTKKTAAAGTTLLAFAGELKLPFKPVAAELDGLAVDLSTQITGDCCTSFIRPDTGQGLAIVRHSTSHVMAQAVQELYPGVKVTIGPSIEDGFYYDFDYDGTFSPEDLDKIEKKMEEIAGRNLPFVRRVLTKQEAIEFFNKLGESYKVEIISELPADTVSLYEQGGFTDLCRGPHVPSTGMIKAFKLISTAGAYWRGDEHNKMLQRIYGTAFADKKALKEHLARIEEAKKRDHRRLGKELDLFSIYDEAGAGLIVYHPKGALVRRILEDFEVRQHLRRGYDMVKGPQILKLDLWERSGHLQNYLENMYFTEVEGKKYGLKPMNCLAHMLIYRSRLRSYKDLPLRYFELGTVNRHEKSGVLHGLTRVREFTQDDAHILCMPEQLHKEISDIITFVKDVMAMFGFEFEVELSTRPAKSIGDDQSWDLATAALREALETNGLAHEVNEGDGAFYGPKIDFKLRDCLKRSWQCATIQCDFILPERFDLTYIGEDGGKHRPVMLHRVILGSIERFMGILIEHFAGAFPVWLSPVQAVVIPISDAQHEFAQQVLASLRGNDLRSDIDLRNESLNLKIREAQLQKIPFMLVVGNKEIEQGGVAVRLRSGENLGFMPLQAAVQKIKDTCTTELQGM
jgi:threonyl-tRNA synthetase